MYTASSSKMLRYHLQELSRAIEKSIVELVRPGE